MAIKENKPFPEDTVSPVTMIEVISKIDLHDGTYNDLINSGNLNLIRDFDLRNKMVDYQTEVEGLRFQEDAFYHFFNDNIIAYLLTEYDLLHNRFIHDETERNPRFSNLFLGYYSMITQRDSSYHHLLERSREMREMIPEE